jgi:ribosomal protein S27AE
MPQPTNFDPTKLPLGQRRCPTCGVPMFLASIEPSDQPDHEPRNFECVTCDYSETATIKFR